MQFTTKTKILGVAFFAGAVDGKDIDSGTLFVEEALDESTERAKGFRSVEYKTPNHMIPKGLLHNSFPMMADITVESKVTKGGSSLIVTAVKPIQLAGNAKAA
ncbi:MAG: hypothetical protein ACM34A_01675 [Bacillota bacterium]